MNTVKCSNHLCGKEYNVQFDKCPFCGTDNPMDEEERKALIEKEKAENISVEDESTSQFHWLIVGLIWISIIFFGVRGVSSSFTNMIFSPTIGIITLVLSLVGMVSLFFILRAKKWALFLWIAYRLAGGVVNGLINTKFDFATNIIIALVNIGLMLLILQIKKNGVSAWSLIFKKKVSKTDNKESVDEEVTSKGSQDATSKQNEKKIIAEQREDKTENCTEIPSQDIADTLYDEQLKHIIPEDKKLEQQVFSTTPPTEEKPEDTFIDTPGDKLNTTDSRDDTPEKKKSLLRGSWWIFLIVIVAVLAAVWIVVYISHRDGNSELGKYVYVDNSSILHSKRDCKNIAVYRGAKPVSILSLLELTSNDWQYICPECVTDKIFEQLQEVQLGTENRLWLYTTLDENGYKLGENYLFFDSISRNREDSRKWCYEMLQKEGFITPSYEDFICDMGYNPNHYATRKVKYEKNNRRKLYDALSEDFDLGLFDDFNYKIDFPDRRRKLFDAVSKTYDLGTYVDFCGKIGIRSLYGVYNELKRISNEKGWDFGIDKYSYEQFRDKYNSTEGLSKLYDALSSISSETGIDFYIGSKEEWMMSFEKSNQDREWLYKQMVAAKINTGSYEYFRYSLSNEEDLKWYYGKCRSLGINVGSIKDFLNQYAL